MNSKNNLPIRVIESVKDNWNAETQSWDEVPYTFEQEIGGIARNNKVSGFEHIMDIFRGDDVPLTQEEYEWLKVGFSQTAVRQ